MTAAACSQPELPKKTSTLALLSTCPTVSESCIVVVVVTVEMWKTDFPKLMASNLLLTGEFCKGKDGIHRKLKI